MTPDLHAYRWIVVNSSGGKDSQTALRETVRLCRAAGVPLDRIVVSHADLGRVEWEGATALARQQAEHYGLRFIVARYRDRAGQERDLLDYVAQRGKWPDQGNRFCTSEFKRSPGNRTITALSREAAGPILQVFGFRSEESPARAKRPVLAPNGRASRRGAPVTDWLPIHDWTAEQVWRDIELSAVPHHPAYDLGMPRLSCAFCIFAPRAALITAGHHNRALLDAYADVEQAIGHRFRRDLAIAEIRDAVLAGERPPIPREGWNL